jgi:hypothetical protein
MKRLSSRPVAKNAARLQAVKANGAPLRERYVARCRQEPRPPKVCQTAVTQERWKLKKMVGEVFGLPALRGPVTQLTKVLRALSRNFSLLW